MHGFSADAVQFYISFVLNAVEEIPQLQVGLGWCERSRAGSGMDRLDSNQGPIHENQLFDYVRSLDLELLRSFVFFLRHLPFTYCKGITLALYYTCLW